MKVASEVFDIAVKRANLRTSMRRYLLARSGNISIIASLSLPVLMGAAGIAADFAQHNSKMSQLQASADAAAIAAAKELGISNATDASIISSAEAFVAAALKGKIGTSVSIDKKKATVKVAVTENWQPSFAHFVGLDVTPLTAVATARLTGTASICVLTLEDDDEKALEMVSSSKITAPKCGIFANSDNSQALYLKTGSRIEAAQTCAVGGVDAAASSIVPAALTDCPKMDDPLEVRPEPSVGTCTYTNVKVSGGAVTLMPGTYCNGIDISGNAFVTFASGDYVIKDGKFKVVGNAWVTGTHVGFFLNGAKAELSFLGNTTVEFTGPTSGPLAGLLFFGDRTSTSRKHRINSANARELTGTIYLPEDELLIDPAGEVAEDSAYTAIITKTLKLGGGPDLVLNSDYSATDVPVPAGIIANAEVVLSE